MLHSSATALQYPGGIPAPSQGQLRVFSGVWQLHCTHSQTPLASQYAKLAQWCDVKLAQPPQDT